MDNAKGDRLGTMLEFWVRGRRNSMWFDDSVSEERIAHLHGSQRYGELESLCEAHYVDGVLVKGERPDKKRK